MAYADKKSTVDGGKGWNAGKPPGKPGTVGKQFPLETKGAKGKLPLGGGKGEKKGSAKGK